MGEARKEQRRRWLRRSRACSRQVGAARRTDKSTATLKTGPTSAHMKIWKKFAPMTAQSMPSPSISDGGGGGGGGCGCLAA